MKKITQETVDNNVQFISDEITHIIKTFETRAPGSKGERDANEYLAGVLENYSDTVKIEEFPVHEASFMGWLPIVICTILLGIVALWFNLNIVALLLVAGGMALTVAQLLFYKHVTKYLFKKKISTNVYAVKKPVKEVKRRIIFCGHTDAAYEWGLLNLGGFPLFITCVIGGFGTAFAVIIYSIVGMVLNGISVAPITEGGFYFIALIVLTIIGVPFTLSLFHFSNRRKIVDGANDNLTACLMSVSMLKTLKDEGIEFENTEVGAIMAGSEEAGLRGAQAFAKAHKDELNEVETIIIVLETLREPECLSIYSKDLNGVVKVTPEVCALLKKAGKEALGIDIPYATVTLGATDAAAFASGGIKSACFAALDHKLQPYYHTRKDSYDNLSPECLDKVYKVCVKALEIFDKEGLN